MRSSEARTIDITDGGESVPSKKSEGRGLENGHKKKRITPVEGLDTTVQGVTFFTKARFFQKTGILSEAEGFYEKAIKFGGQEVQIKANFNLGLMLHQKGEIEKAIKYYKEAIKIGSQAVQVMANFNLGKIYWDQGQTKRAIECYEELVRIGLPEIKEKANFNLGMIYLEQGDKEKAKEHLKNAAEMGMPMAQLKLIQEFQEEEVLETFLKNPRNTENKELLRLLIDKISRK